MLPDNCSIVEAHRIAYGELLATSHAMNLQAEQIRLQIFTSETSFDAFMRFCEEAAETHDKKITEFTVDVGAPPGLFSERIELARSAAAVAYRRLITDGMLTKDKLAKEKEKQKKMEQNALDKAACLQPQEVLEKWATGFLQSRFGKR